MSYESQEKLEVSRAVVEQLNAMASNSAASVGSGQAPRSPGPGPAPSPTQKSDDHDSEE